MKYGAKGDRTPDLVIANDALYQLSYCPEIRPKSKSTPFSPQENPTTTPGQDVHGDEWFLSLPNGCERVPSMDSFFTDLGQTVYDRWKQENFDLSVFPGIAEEALRENPPSDHVDLGSLIQDFLLNDEQPFQTSSGFGQPELIVYDNPKFYIQILFWLDGTTDIHQHEFSGAFHVMEGSSIHSHFEFGNVRPVTAHFRLGDLKLKDATLLETGSTVQIISGRSCIHSLFHLEIPSVTVVIRTHSDPGTGPQFTYLPPHVAVDPVHHDALTMRRKQLLDVLEQTGDADYADLVAEMVSELDFERGLFILQNCMTHLRNLGSWEDAWEVFSAKHGDLAEPVAPTLREIIRRDGIAAMRSTVEDVEHRFFLALLLNLERREDILDMVSVKSDADPLETILRWAEELTHMTESGTWILDAGFPEELGIANEEQPSLFLAALSHFIAGGKAAAELKSLSVSDLALLRETFARSSWRALLPPLRGKTIPSKETKGLKKSKGSKKSGASKKPSGSKHPKQL